jgi:hypothetical protein
MALRYVERNALRAELVSRAEDWKFTGHQVARAFPVQSTQPHPRLAMVEVLYAWNLQRDQASQDER